MNEVKRVVERLAVERYMREAIAKPENREENGYINWNFVDADVFMELRPAGEFVGRYYKLFEEIADIIEEELIEKYNG
jgi:hypothetical protein